MTGAIRLAAANAKANYTRFALSAVAVALSVAFVTATLVLGSSVAGTAAEDTAAANATIDAVVEGPVLGVDDEGPGGETAFRASLPPEAVDAVEAVGGVANAEGVTAGFAKLVVDGRAVGTGTDLDIGRSWIADPALNPFTVVSGAAPVAGGDVAIDQALVSEAGLRIGDGVEVLTPTGVHQLTLTGTTNYGPAAGAPLQRTVHFAPDTAAELLQADRLSQIVIRADPGVDAVALADGLEAAVPGSEATSGADYIARLQAGVTSPFTFLTLFLLAFAGIATVVATTIIYNTFSIAIAQRRQELALMRAMGAQRGQVMWAVMVEAVLVGATATAVGLVAGLFGVGLLRRLMDLLGAGFLSGPTVIEPLSLAVAAAIGVVVTIVSVWAPARQGAAAAPVEALREAAAEPPTTSLVRTVSGFVLLAMGAAAMAWAVAASSNLLLTGAVLLVPGLILAGPALVGATASVSRFGLSRLGGAGGVGRLGGATGTIATTNLARNRRRAASTTLALTLGVALIAFFTVLASSFTTSVTRQLDASLRADYVVTSVTPEVSTIDPALAGSLAAIDGVDTVAPLRVAEAAVDGAGEGVGGIDPAALARVFDLGVTAGSLDGLAAGGVAVLTPEVPDAAVGDVVTVEFAGQTVELPVAATFTNSFGGFEAPSYLVSLQTLQAHESGLLDTSIFVGATGSGVAAQVQAAVADSPGALFETKSSYIAGTSTEIDSFRNLIWAMLGLTVVLALVGVANTTTLAVRERVREIGTLRAIGTTARGVRRIIRLEAGLLAALGALIGLALAAVGGWATIEVLAGAELGSVAIPWLSLAVIGAGAVVAGVLAAAYPAWRASRMPPLDALAVTS